MTESAIIAIIILVAPIVGIAIWIYMRQQGIRRLCPNCGQRQVGWSTQYPKCGIVFKDWEKRD